MLEKMPLLLKMMPLLLLETHHADALGGALSISSDSHSKVIREVVGDYKLVGTAFGHPKYMKMSSTVTRYLYRAKSGTWSITGSEANIEKSKGTVVSTFPSENPTLVQFKYFDSGSWRNDESFIIVETTVNDAGELLKTENTSSAEEVHNAEIQFINFSTSDTALLKNDGSEAVEAGAAAIPVKMTSGSKNVHADVDETEKNDLADSTRAILTNNLSTILDSHGLFYNSEISAATSESEGIGKSPAEKQNVMNETAHYVVLVDMDSERNIQDETPQPDLCNVIPDGKLEHDDRPDLQHELLSRQRFKTFFLFEVGSTEILKLLRVLEGAIILLCALLLALFVRETFQKKEPKNKKGVILDAAVGSLLKNEILREPRERLRMVSTELEAARIELQTRSDEAQSLRNQLTDAMARSDALAKEVTSAKTDAVGSTNAEIEALKLQGLKYRSAEADIKLKDITLETIRRELGQSRSEIKAMKIELDETRAKLAATSNDLSACRISLSANDAKLASAKVALESSQTKLLEQKSELAALGKAASASRVQPTDDSMRKELVATRSQLRNEQANLEASIVKLELAQAELEARDIDLARLRRDLLAAQADAQASSRNAQAASTRTSSADEAIAMLKQEKSALLHELAILKKTHETTVTTMTEKLRAADQASHAKDHVSLLEAELVTIKLQADDAAVKIIKLEQSLESQKFACERQRGAFQGALSAAKDKAFKDGQQAAAATIEKLENEVEGLNTVVKLLNSARLQNMTAISDLEAKLASATEELAHYREKPVFSGATEKGHIGGLCTSAEFARIPQGTSQSLGIVPTLQGSMSSLNQLVENQQRATEIVACTTQNGGGLWRRDPFLDLEVPVVDSPSDSETEVDASRTETGLPDISSVAETSSFLDRSGVDESTGTIDGW